MPNLSVSVMMLPADTVFTLPIVKAAGSARLVAPAAMLASEVACTTAPGD